jgi:hypothetical protein
LSYRGSSSTCGKTGRRRPYYVFDDAGEATAVAMGTDDSVRVATSLLRRYQAARQLHLALFLDSTLWSETLEGELEWETYERDATLKYYRATLTGDRPFSRLFGKRVLSPATTRGVRHLAL